MRTLLRTLAITLGIAASASAQAGNTTPYYLFSGDDQKAVEISGGVVVNSFNIPSLGYPAAVSSTIWLGNRDNNGAAEFGLNGVATGKTSAGAGGISQLLDGTTNGAAHNYGVTCCGLNAVTVANPDWSGQTPLFDLPDNGSGIAFDTAAGTLFVSLYSGLINQYALSGTLLSSFSTEGFIAGLAYEQNTDTLWGWDRDSQSLRQFSTDGALLQTNPVDVRSYGVNNPFGGEMATVTNVPEPASFAVLGAGLVALGWLRRRRA